MNIKKNDTVIVLSGKYKGTKGKVQVVLPKEDKVVVEGVNIATCHTKPRKQGDQGGIVKRETPIRACKVMLVCPKCGLPTRIAHKRVERTISGKKKMVSIRVCKSKNDKCLAEDI